MFDDSIWANADPNDLWLYDKLILSKKLGYKCGLPGVPVDTPGTYIVRPISNVLGMGISASMMYLHSETDFIKPGHFWCEKFTGRHLTVDYIDGQQVKAVEGFRTESQPLWKWNRWERVDIKIPFPSVLNSLVYKKHINCEFIDGKLIEAHQRLNNDLTNYEDGEYDIAIPVWQGEPQYLADQGYTYHVDNDYLRTGFWKK